MDYIRTFIRYPFSFSNEDAFEEDISSLHIKKLLGSGSFGSIYLVATNNDIHYALKRLFNKKSKSGRESASKLQPEIGILGGIDHPNIVKIYRSIFVPSIESFLVLQDFYQGGDLFSLLSNQPTLPVNLFVFWSSQLLSALFHLHHNLICYRDLKPENCCLDLEGNICLIDFGLSKKLEEKEERMRSTVGSDLYLAPEILNKEVYGMDVDFWALGCVVFEMLGFDHPFNTVGLFEDVMDSQNELIFRGRILGAIKSRKKPSLPSELHPHIKTLLRLLLEPDYEKRRETFFPSNSNSSSSSSEDPPPRIASLLLFHHTDWENLRRRDGGRKYSNGKSPWKPFVEGEEDCRYFPDSVDLRSSQSLRDGWRSNQEEEEIKEGEESFILNIHERKRLEMVEIWEVVTKEEEDEDGIYLYHQEGREFDCCRKKEEEDEEEWSQSTCTWSSSNIISKTGFMDEDEKKEFVEYESKRSSGGGGDDDDKKESRLRSIQALKSLTQRSKQEIDFQERLPDSPTRSSQTKKKKKKRWSFLNDKMDDKEEGKK